MLHSGYAQCVNMHVNIYNKEYNEENKKLINTKICSNPVRRGLQRKFLESQ